MEKRGHVSVKAGQTREILKFQGDEGERNVPAYVPGHSYDRHVWRKRDAGHEKKIRTGPIKR